MKPLKERISITIDSDLLEKIKPLAENCDRALSQFINIVLKYYFATSESRDEKLENILKGF